MKNSEIFKHFQVCFYLICFSPFSLFSKPFPHIKTTVFDAFIRIANYMHKRVELKKDLVIGDGSLDPSLTVKDISCFYGFKGSKYIHELMKTHQREFNKEEVLDWETRSLEKNFGSHVEMTSRQFCEIFTNVACGLQAAPTLVNKGVDNDLLDKVAKILEKKINLVHDDVGDDYRMLRGKDGRF